MIPFDEIDARLDALKKDRAWLAANTPYSAAYIRDVMAPNSTRKSERIQRILSEAIEREELRSKAHVPDQIVLNPSSERFDAWSMAFKASPYETFREWINAMIEAGRERSSAAPPPININPISKPEYWLDLLGGVAAGASVPGDAPSDPVRVGKAYPDDHYLLRVYGQSMEPKIPDGALIVVRRWDQGLPKQNTIVVYSDGAGSTLKKFGYRKAEPGEDADAMGNVPVLRSINDAFSDATTMEGGRIEAVFVETL